MPVNDGDTRREGDDRPLHRPPGAKLNHIPDPGEPIRWLPRHGDPFCSIDALSQWFVKTLAYWPVYTALVTTVILLIIIFHPWGLGR